MFSGMFFWLMICLLLFAIGDVLSVITKARLSSVFIAPTSCSTWAP